MTTGTRARRSVRRWPALVALALAGIPSSGAADPLRLRGDALAAAESPVGLLSLQADDDLRPWLTAEALVWTGAGDDVEADALVVAVKLRDPKGRGELRLGRFVLAAGGLLPVHVDGIAARYRAPYRFSVEAFSGFAVVPRLHDPDETPLLAGVADSDWLAGGRISRATGDWGSAGVAYMMRRDGGNLSDHEIAVDGNAVPLDWLDLGARASYDLITTGLSEAHASLAARRGDWRVELFGTHRSPGRLLPATSLFSVIGDVPSRRGGANVRWRAAPRLDLHATAAMRALEDDLGASLSGRGLLRLDDQGAASVGLELRRESAPDVGWTGVRATGQLPLRDGVTAATELELVVPDESEGRGKAWPWALVALRWQIAPTWTAAGAVEASASPEHEHRVDAIVRISRAWEMMK